MNWSSVENEPLATYSEFQRSLLLREQRGHDVRPVRERGFVLWRIGTIRQEIERFRGYRGRVSASLWANINQAIQEFEHELEECFPFTTA